MNNKLENEVNSIVKFVTEMFHPDDVWVKPYHNPERYSIILYFNDVDDKYITNPLHGNQKEHKANMFKREIRAYIQNFLGIKTSGVQPPHFHSPEEIHPISIYVRYIV